MVLSDNKNHALNRSRDALGGGEEPCGRGAGKGGPQREGCLEAFAAFVSLQHRLGTVPSIKPVFCI